MENNMKNAADVVIALQNTSGRLDKEQILRDAWKLGITEFFAGARLAYDAMTTFGVKKVPLIAEADVAGFVPLGTAHGFTALAQNLITRQLTGNAARDALSAAADTYTQHMWNGFYRRVLLKDLKCGVTEATINKVLAEMGKSSRSYEIPVFSCQLAKNGDDLPKKVSGIKMLDRKLDGVRLLTVLHKESNTVTQFTRNGKINENFTDLAGMLVRLLPVLTQSMVLDGEVVSSNFQALMTQVNRKSDVDTSDSHLALFDIVPLADFQAGECRISQRDRHELLVGLTEAIARVAGDRVYVIPKLTVDLRTPEGQRAFQEFNRETVMAGYEGIMVKDPDASYRTKRTDGWLKIKPSVTFDLEIVGVEIGTPGTKFANTMGNLICRGEDQGKIIETSVGSGFSEELREEIWANRDKLVGRIVEIKCDVLTQNRNSDTWSMRFPVFMQFRGWEPGEKL
jgi:DNA ligase-1